MSSTNNTNNKNILVSSKGAGIKSGLKSPRTSGPKRERKRNHSGTRMVKGSSVMDLSPVSLTRCAILDQCKLISNLRTMVEYKEPVPMFRGRDAPNSLTIPSSGYQHIDTKESLALSQTLQSFFQNREYEFRLSTALNMSSSGAGIVNSTISNSTLASQADFAVLVGIFNEYFIRGFTVKWQPISEYQFPLTGLPDGKTVANVPIGKADLQHGQAAYSSLTLMSDNFGFGYHSTGRSFTERWVNSEHRSDQTVPSLTAPTQGWCPVNNAANYQGTLQFISQSAPPGLPVSSVLGTFIVHWDVIFRVRV